MNDHAAYVSHLSTVIAENNAKIATYKANLEAAERAGACTAEDYERMDAQWAMVKNLRKMNCDLKMLMAIR
jgi:hypothetical protein